MKPYKIFTIFCVSWFIFLCLLHYFSLRPLWLDENFIFENIKTLTTKEILGPLKNCQAFPRVYLILIQNFSQKFSHNIFSLRFFPLAAMFSAFFVWAKIYKKEFVLKWHSLLALFSFTSSYYLSYYAAELKPYSMDVLVVGIFCLYLFNQRQYVEKVPSKPLIVWTLLLPFTIFFSYASFFVFWIVIYNFLFIVRKNSKFLPVVITYTFMCFLFTAFVFYYDLRYSLSLECAFSYWQDYFLCTDSFYCFIKPFGEGLRKLAVWWFGNSSFFRRAASFLIPLFAISLFGYGIKSLKKDKFRLWNIESLSLVIFLELIVLGMMKIYPFTGERITLFFAPFVFYSIIRAIVFFKSNKLVYFSLNILYITFLFICSFNSYRVYLKLYD